MKTIEQRLTLLEKQVDAILVILNEKEIDYKNQKFLCLENVFDTTDNVNPMLRQGEVYQVSPDNRVNLTFGRHSVSFNIREFLNRFSNYIKWLVK